MVDSGIENSDRQWVISLCPLERGTGSMRQSCLSACCVEGSRSTVSPHRRRLKHKPGPRSSRKRISPVAIRDVPGPKAVRGVRPAWGRRFLDRPGGDDCQAGRRPVSLAILRIRSVIGGCAGPIRGVSPSGGVPSILFSRNGSRA